MRISAKKITVMAALAAVIGLASATPAHADWYHRGGYGYYQPWHAYGYPYGYRPVYYGSGYYPAPTVIVTQPQPVYVAAPQPVYAQPAWFPFGINLGIHIR